MIVEFIKFSLVLVVFVSNISAQNSCEENRLYNVTNGLQKLRGVNLDNWFVLDSWMNSKIWEENGCNKVTNNGNYLLEKCLGSRAKSVMEKHWSTYITEADFIQMSELGINTVRIPVGWWQIYDPMGGVSNAQLNYYITPRDYVTGGLEYIDRAFNWGKNGIAILLGMHGAPGSQNRKGSSSPAEHPIEINWDKYPANVGQTVDSMELYAKRYGRHEALFGFYLLNKPEHINLDVLQDYYQRAYTVVRNYSPESYIIINPLYEPFEFGTEPHWTGFMNPSDGYTKVGMDLHYYSCFGGPSDQTNPDGAINYIRWDRKYQIIDYMEKNPKPMLIGGWSSCGRFALYRVPEFTKIQIDVYNTANLGWIYWSWKNGPPGNVWSMKNAFKSKWIDPLYVCNIEHQLDPKIVLSYVVKESRKEVIQLKKDLEAIGFSQIYLDINEIESGEDWTDVLNDMVLNCDVFIALITSQYGCTKWTKREFKLADIKNKYIIPINFVDNWPPDCLAIQLSSTQYIKWNSKTTKIAEDIKFDLQKNFKKANRKTFLHSLSVDSLNKNQNQRSVSFKSRPKIVISFHKHQKNFTEFLRKRLSSEFDIWSEGCEDKTNDNQTNHSNEYLRKQFKSEVDSASLVIPILSESYISSKTCKQQAFYSDYSERFMPIKYGQFIKPKWLSDLFNEDKLGVLSADSEWLSLNDNYETFIRILKNRILKLINN